MTFHDHYSAVAGRYASYRPRYPAALALYLADLEPGRERAWDCGTGNGQAAVALAEAFAQVVATDPSAGQLSHAQAHPRVSYRIGRESESGLSPRSADLVTAAQAAHWFDHAAFHREVARVLRPGGILAVWCYELMSIDPAIDTVVDRFYRVRVGRYWPPERKSIEHQYRDLPFPYPDLTAPAFTMETILDRAGLLGYLGTWSAVQRCRAAEGIDPIAELTPEIERAWPDAAERRRAVWPLTIRLGRAPGDEAGR